MELRTALKLWMILFTIVTLLLVIDNRRLTNKADHRASEAQHLAQQIKEAQDDIQRSRLEACIANQNSLLQAFAPFTPKIDDPTTSRNEVKDWKKFTDNLKVRRDNCKNIIKPKKERK